MFDLLKRLFSDHPRTATAELYVEDPDGPFRWARDAGFEVFAHPGGHETSLGGGEPFDGANGPLGFTDRDAEILDAYLAECERRGADAAGWVVEATDEREWLRLPGRWDPNF